MKNELQEIRDKMEFFGYSTRNLDHVAIKFNERFGEYPKAYLVKTPFGIVGNIKLLDLLVVSQRYCSKNSVFVPLHFNKKELENALVQLGEEQKRCFARNREAERRTKIESEERQKAALAKFNMHFCQYCSDKYEYFIYRPKPHCGKSECEEAHKEELRKKREGRQASKSKQNNETPEFSLDNPNRAALHGYIYLIRAENGLCKIGRSDDVEDRYRDLTTMSPVPVYLEHYIFSVNYVRAEASAHELLDKYRHHGEWFDLPECQVNWFVGLSDYALDPS